MNKIKEDFAPAMEFSYELDDFQKKGIKEIENNNNVLIIAHTGAGKSTFAEYATACASRDNKKIIYTSPIKTLSNQKFNDFKLNHKRYNMEIEDFGIMTGDNKINPDAQCIVMTTEILRNSLYKNNEIMKDLKYVVFDEVHYFNDKERGHVWEECLILLPKHVILILLSATISRANDFANWIQKIRERKTICISTPFRPVPLKHYLLIPGEAKLINYINSKNNTFMSENYVNGYQDYKINMKKKGKMNPKHSINELVKTLKIKGLVPSIVFTFSRKMCEINAKSITENLVDHLERKKIEKLFDMYVHKLIETEDNLNQIAFVKNMVMKGIGIHHSGLLPPLKEIVEILFGNKNSDNRPEPLIKVLFATETFAVGVNMPAKCVIYTNLNKYDNYSGLRNLYSHEYTQMSGRAGRRGLDKEGIVIYYPIREMETIHNMKSIVINKPEILSSKFLINIPLVLKTLKSDELNIMNTIKASLMNKESEILMESLKSRMLEIEKILEKKNNELKLFKDDNISLVKLYRSQSNNLKNLKKNQKKKFYKIFLKTKQEFEDLKLGNRIDGILNGIDDLSDEYNKLKLDLRNLDLSEIDELNKILEFLKEYKFINDREELNIQNIENKDITLKGIICSEFNEANEILMTEILDKKLLDNLIKKDILVILSIFCESFDKENDYFIEDLDVSRDVKDTLKKIQTIHEKILNDSQKYNIYYKPKISLQSVEMVEYWCENKSLSEIMERNNIFEGNFIKNIKKVENIIKELNDVCELSQNHIILQKLQTIESLIIKDIVDHKSLYLI